MRLPHRSSGGLAPLRAGDPPPHRRRQECAGTLLGLILWPTIPARETKQKVVGIIMGACVARSSLGSPTASITGEGGEGDNMCCIDGWRGLLHCCITCMGQLQQLGTIVLFARQKKVCGIRLPGH